MGIELVFLAIALICVGLTRGSYKQLLSTRFNHWWTLLVAVAGQLVVAFAPIPKSQYDTTGLAILLATYVLLFGFCVANINIKGMWVVLTGLACNAIVIGLNKGMPVTNSGNYAVTESIKHQPASSSDLLPWLSDIFPINRLSIAISVGDIILGMGLIAVCFYASRKPEVDAEDIATMPDMIETDFENSDITQVAHSRSAYANDLEVVIDLTNEIQEPVYEPDEPVEAAIEIPEAETFAAKELPTMTTSARSPQSRKSSTEQKMKSEKIKNTRRRKKWQKTHGLAALPSKEELGFDEESMEIVESAH